MTNLKYRIKNIFGVSGSKVTIYITFIIACFLLFRHGDLLHTARSSYAFINAHFFDFYEYNKLHMGRNDYLPILYSVFAIWNIPLKLFNLTSNFGIDASSQAAQLVWWKLLITTFFFASTYVIYNISLLTLDSKSSDSKLAFLLFASSPIAIFSTFIFSGYDIIGMFFSLLGFYYYLKKDLTKFSWLFSVAIGFKYFAFVLYLPLILFAEKRISYLFKYLLIALSLTFIQFILYWHSDIFRSEIFNLANRKAGGAFTEGLVYLGIYIFLLLILYFKKISNDNDKKIIIFLIPIAAYACMFSAVRWHPQWLILITPYFALSYYFIKHKKIYFFAEVIGSLAFIWITVNVFSNNVDVNLINQGVLKSLIPEPSLIISDFLGPEYISIFKKIFLLYLFFPILLIFYEYLMQKKINQINHFNFERFLSIRFLLGNSSFFGFALICAFIPMSLAISINPDATFKKLNEEILAPQAQIVIGQIFGNQEVIQTFKASSNNFSGFKVRLASYKRTNNQPVKFILKSADGEIIMEEILSAKIIHDNSYKGFIFPVQLNSKDKLYKLFITSPASFSGNAITAWATKNDDYPNGELTFAGNKLVGDLVMNLYYQPNGKIN